MRNDKGQFTKGNSGKPKGAKNKAPNKAELYKLLDRICENLNENFERLTYSQQIRILTHFNTLYKTDEEIQQGLEPRVFNLINSDEELKKLYNVQ